MSRKKQHRFEHNIIADNVIERGKELYTSIKGKWNEVFFKNSNPITVELACGKGEYTVGLSKQFPDVNFIGVDIKGDRIARGSKKAMDLNLSNVAFLRTGIQYLDEFFEPEEIDEIWLVHPDPQPRDKEEKRRLTNQKFLDIYKIYLKNEGIFHLKTDSEFLFDYSLEVIKADPEFELLDYTDDLYNSDLREGHFDIVTHYEKLFNEKGATIHYLKAKLIKKAS
ncbi:tRNA (guanosine(46)-N7)-methyltransferase TrmB [Lacihabitans sp. CCS-44]|uniref:tRNA (guanosine(46)-N7)-methyltransferase TrmB n=1 Tax=Lacihabitans sp. CCS-44 TaxID=2487331 RepID=UPI0020CDF318|nr:tRNA (guanosine(46)-N7)-methyltransferase TrmB [Lacihabitans sp. CCS-44]MCP9756985.1 tRNA (guanosine(46)-N7)-methyltransferase TrmB [Lacihabitans sp. CCS-44]